MSSQSTSFNKINGSGILPFYRKIVFLFNNFVSNFFPNIFKDEDLKIRKLICNANKEYWPDVSETSSPSRLVCDLFWKNLPWSDIKKELGEIDILDIGCGSGTYGELLQKWSGGFNRYTGTDYKKNSNWELLKAKYSNFSFFEASAMEINKFIPEGTNFVITQSAIEHFEKDILFFQEIKKYIIECKKNLIQIHLFPSAACLHLYLFHGYRQYTPRKISKITRPFNDFSYSMLYELGGKHSNNLHFKYITWPALIKPYFFKAPKIDLRELKTVEYNTELEKALKNDISEESSSPSFYALVIHSNYKNKIFDQK